MKIKNVNVQSAAFPSKSEFQKLQWRKGWALSFIGLFVYAFLRLIGKKPKEYYGVCKYFEIGKGWGGFEMGWFFVCCSDATEHVKSHEVGHGIQNANVGGLRMLGCSIGSMLRYWYREITHPKTAYDSWWFEGNATALGSEYIKRIKSGKIPD